MHRKKRKRIHMGRVILFLVFPFLLLGGAVFLVLSGGMEGRMAKSWDRQNSENGLNISAEEDAIRKEKPFDGKLTEKEVSGGIPRLMQWDGRWGKTVYGDSDIALSGCGPTCVSMVAAGLTGDAGVTPVLVADYSQRNGYYDSENGTSWGLIREGVGAFGLVSEELPLDEALMKQTLNEGMPIICSMGAGDFTTTGHFIVLIGVEEDKFRLHDPNSIERSEKLWDYETMAPQIRNLWAIHAS